LKKIIAHPGKQIPIECWWDSICKPKLVLDKSKPKFAHKAFWHEGKLPFITKSCLSLGYLTEQEIFTDSLKLENPMFRAEGVNGPVESFSFRGLKLI